MRKSGERGEMKSDKRIEREGEDAERGTKGKTRGGGREVRKEEGGQWEETGRSGWECVCGRCRRRCRGNHTGDKAGQSDAGWHLASDHKHVWLHSLARPFIDMIACVCQACHMFRYMFPGWCRSCVLFMLFTTGAVECLGCCQPSVMQIWTATALIGELSLWDTILKCISVFLPKQRLNL